MLRLARERHWEAGHGDGGGGLPVEDELLIALGGEAKQLGLFWDHGDVVGVGNEHNFTQISTKNYALRTKQYKTKQ